MKPDTYLPNTKIPFDAEHLAKKIIACHTEGYLQGIHAEYDDNRAMMEDMYSKCASILTDELLEGKLTPMQFAAVRNELGTMIWNIFKDAINAEDAAKANERLAQIAMEVMLGLNK